MKPSLHVRYKLYLNDAFDLTRCVCVFFLLFFFFFFFCGCFVVVVFLLLLLFLVFVLPLSGTVAVKIAD